MSCWSIERTSFWLEWRKMKDVISLYLPLLTNDNWFHTDSIRWEPLLTTRNIIFLHIHDNHWRQRIIQNDSIEAECTRISHHYWSPALFFLTSCRFWVHDLLSANRLAIPPSLHSVKSNSSAYPIVDEPTCLNMATSKSDWFRDNYPMIFADWISRSWIVFGLFGSQR